MSADRWVALLWFIGFLIAMVAWVCVGWKEKPTHSQAQGQFVMALMWPLLPLMLIGIAIFVEIEMRRNPSKDLQ